VDSPFDVLGIEPGADEAEIDRAYRRRVKETHPDQGGSAAEFGRVREAYEELKSGAGIEPEPTAASATSAAERSAAGSAASGSDTGGGRRTEPGGRAPGAGDAAAGEPDAEPEAEEPDTAEVEYLDYDAITDNGWDLGDEDLFEKAADADLDRANYGVITVRTDKPLLETAEGEGLSWPYACRGSACANCAVAVVEGDMSMPGDHVLSDSMVERGIRLSCAGAPTSDRLRVVVNVKQLPGLDELRLPADRFEGSF
jgi:curved DNA-binding protein CbpA